jgi:hypothetical protein
VTLAIIACVIFVSCGDEGEVVKDEPSAQPSPGEPTLEPFTPQPSQPAEQTPQPVEQMPQPPEQQQPQPGGQMPEPPAQPQPVEQQPQPQPEPPRVEQMPQPEPEPPAALPGLPDDTAGYDQWLKLNAQPIPPVPGFDPHRGTKNVYVNQAREVIAPNDQQQFPYPDGAIVVKEAVRPDKDFIGLVAVMWKEAGTNPAFGDWRFEEYTRNAPDAEFRLIASGAACSGCHSGAAATDFVFVLLE